MQAIGLLIGMIGAGGLGYCLIAVGSEDHRDYAMPGIGIGLVLVVISYGLYHYA